MEEAIEWVKRIPNPEGEHSVVEIRPVVEADDFGENSRRSCVSGRGKWSGSRGRRPKRARSGAWRVPTFKRTIKAVWRIESAGLIAGIARLVRDVGLRRPAREAGRLDEARAEFERAALLTPNSRQRGALLARATAHAAPR